MASISIYEYKPISDEDGIRLLELQPNKDLSSPIHSRLIHTTISMCVEDIYMHYTALSYVWGSPEKNKTIIVDGSSLSITDSLHAAIHDLRDQNHTLLLWADGVCINQSDEEEKTAQIRIMGQIYTSARHTVAYLGPANRNDEERILRSLRPPFTITDSLKEKSEKNWSKKLSLTADARLDKILSRQWFGRVWVFQELVFSASPWIQCGRTRVRWERFYQALRKEKSEDDGTGQASISEAPATSIVSQMHEAWEHHGKRLTSYSAPDNTVLSYYSGERVVFGNTLIDLLLARRGLGVTDPRDMVFAHLGFATDGQLWTTGMDYSKTVSQLFLDVAWWIQNLATVMGTRLDS
ncbi:HET-domain-containing protein [Mytilinidion resinicola]|uniref:HET-domain-containing protein n=1 Tax=Mytilinidion resinicola TaxID=574789 RepID=A0A6A6YVS7_9PEZI|nr:HET-domain-containing protein [Mytilinidion resinicola]KAF2812658.1 HET-domain-containing protein [Mytilinidion resinicola]